MSYSDAKRPTYYPEEYDYSSYYQNEFANYAEPTYASSIRGDPHGYRTKKTGPLPTINYLNERRCPIYIHRIKNDSSVFNNYNENFSTQPKTSRSPRINPQTSSKFVLDKLEETYWATWKPKKESVPVKQKSPRKMFNLENSDIRPAFRIHIKGSKKMSNKPHGDVTNKIIKYFKSNNFESSTTSASINPEDSIKKKSSHLTETAEYDRKLGKKIGKISEKDSVSQEIQTVVHCPVILEQVEQDSANCDITQGISGKEEEINQPNQENCAEKDRETKGDNKTDNQPKEKKNKFEKKDRKKNDENKSKHPKNVKKTKKVEQKSRENSVSNGTEENMEFPTTFVEHKDSIEIAKEKQEKSGKKEHYQQPKCIRLYRKSGITTGIIKGGTYPLKSCLKKDGSFKGNFRLGAPGSPLFVTSSSFSNKRRK